MIDLPALSYGLFHAQVRPNKLYGIVTTGITMEGLNIDVGHLRHIRWTQDDNPQSAINNKPELTHSGRTAAHNRWIAYNKMRGQYGSAMEHAIPEQFWVDRNKCSYLDDKGQLKNPSLQPCAEAISAVKAIAIAQNQGQKIYTINKDNAATALPKLSLSGSVGQEIRNAIEAGKEVSFHEKVVWVALACLGLGNLLHDPNMQQAKKTFNRLLVAKLAAAAAADPKATATGIAPGAPLFTRCAGVLAQQPGGTPTGMPFAIAGGAIVAAAVHAVPSAPLPAAAAAIGRNKLGTTTTVYPHLAIAVAAPVAPFHAGGFGELTVQRQLPLHARAAHLPPAAAFAAQQCVVAAIVAAVLTTLPASSRGELGAAAAVHPHLAIAVATPVAPFHAGGFGELALNCHAPRCARTANSPSTTAFAAQQCTAGAPLPPVARRDKTSTAAVAYPHAPAAALSPGASVFTRGAGELPLNLCSAGKRQAAFAISPVVAFASGALRGGGLHHADKGEKQSGKSGVCLHGGFFD